MVSLGSTWAGLPSTASAQEGGGRFISGVRPEAHMDLFYHNGKWFGLGGRVEIPLVQQGLLVNVNDELALAPGFDFLINDFAFAPMLALQWNFYFGNQWSVFPDLGFVIIIGDHGHAHADAVFEIGGRYHFNDRNALMLRIGWPGLLQFGVTF
jgi:hypothetical protein